MGMKEVLEENINKKIIVFHDEAGNPHTIVGTVKSVDNEILHIISDRGQDNWIRIDTVVKVKSVGD